ncbi:MAG TPA: hypothetical protein VN772_04665, partial [Solirubrobacteraceae bacterium]|nr:hypothetical protein [Solirubrobacteraceae bacterium]
GAPEDELGTSVAVSGATAVVGAPVAKVGANIEQGKAYVFTEPGGGWGSHELGEGVTQAAKLTASDGAPGDKLGLSVAASGTTVIAGAPEATIGKNEFQGATYVFSQPAGGWSGELHQVAKLTASDGGREDELGSAVAISGQTALAGARRHQVGSNVHQGAAYVFGYPAPSVTITTPANGAVYTQGQVVDASYACSAPAGATVTACAGPVANGAALDTSALGAHAFTVETADSDGVGASQSVGYTVVAAPVCACGVPLVLGGAPTLSGLSETARIWREGSAPASISANAHGKKKPPLGTTFSFSLNVPASVTFRFTQAAGGRKVGKRCLAQTNRNKGKRRCTRTLLAGTLTFAAHAGTNKVRFDGLISKHVKLRPGGYTLRATAIASGKQSATRTLQFTIA